MSEQFRAEPGSPLHAEAMRIIHALKSTMAEFDPLPAYGVFLGAVMRLVHDTADASDGTDEEFEAFVAALVSGLWAIHREYQRASGLLKKDN